MISNIICISLNRFFRPKYRNPDITIIKFRACQDVDDIHEKRRVNMWEFDSGSLIISVIGILVGLLIFFLIIREIICWYYKINEHSSKLSEISDKLSNISRQLDESTSATKQTKPPARL